MRTLIIDNLLHYRVYYRQIDLIMVDIKANIEKVKQRIEAAARRVNRNPSEIILLAATKDVPVELIEKAIQSGITYIGENRIQEARSKYEALKEKYPQVNWHFIGHLQTNKVKKVLDIFSTIESVDSRRLIEDISKKAEEKGKQVNIFIEVNTSGEASKFGVTPEETGAVVSFASRFKNLKIKGLMTIAPLAQDPEKARPYFRRLKELREDIKKLNIAGAELDYLSMGMTDDFEVAVEEGSNIVRIGRAIFGIEH